jgi:hypothetical protein
MNEKGYIFTEDDRREFNRMRHKLDTLAGPNVRNTPSNICIGSPAVNSPLINAQGATCFEVISLLAPVTSGAQTYVPPVATCKTYTNPPDSSSGGPVIGSQNVSIAMVVPHGPGELLWAAPVKGGTGFFSNGSTGTQVMWREIGSYNSLIICGAALNDSSTNGNAGVRCRFTYDLHSLSGGTLLATNLTPVRPRPFGMVTDTTPVSEYGLSGFVCLAAINQAGYPYIWEVGETATSVHLSPTPAAGYGAPIVS